MNTADTIRSRGKHVGERKLPQGSHFHARFKDDSDCHEGDTNWSDMSTEKEVEYFGMTKRVRVSKHPVKNIKIAHDGMEIDMAVPEGCEVYQAIRAEVLFTPGGGRTEHILGRVVGLVKDGKVIEERFINAQNHEIMGVRA